MRTSHRAIAMTIWFCMVTVASQSLAAEPQQRWTMQMVEHPDASSLVIKDINDAGDAAGFAFLGFGQVITHKPFIWQDGAPTILPTTAYWTDGYRMNEAGLCVGIDMDTGHAIHYTASGVSDLGDLGDLFGVNMYFPAMNEAGQFAGYRPLGSSRHEAFTWDSKSGLRLIAPEEMSSQANDINEAGAVVGYTGLYYNAKAYLYKDGIRTDFASSWPGATRALSIDDAGRILVEHDEDSIGTAVYQVVDADTLDVLYEGPQFSADAYTEQVIANANGEMAVSWLEDPAQPHLGWWTPAKGMQEIPLPEDSLQAIIIAANDNGQMLGILHDINYESMTFIASADGGFTSVQENIIGEAPINHLSVIDINNAGQVAIQFSSNSYGACAILTPARPGDVNGDGVVNGADLANILGNWGAYPTGSVCGPDLNMDGMIDGVDLTICLGDWDLGGL